MTDAAASATTEDFPPALWKHSSRRSRKAACSNIFTGISLRQLHGLFRAAGDKVATHRARLLLRRMGAELQGVEEDVKEEEEDSDCEAALARALVGLRLRSRRKPGMRKERLGDGSWIDTSRRSSGEKLDCTAEDCEAHLKPKPAQPALKHPHESRSPIRRRSWRVDVAAQERATDSDRHLHHVRH